MFSFAVDYFIMVFIASLGVMQAAASIGGLRGLLLFKNPIIARLLGIAIAIAAIAWFFAVAERNINDYEGGLDSNQQGALFFLAVAASGVLTCILTTLVNWRMVDPRPSYRHSRESGNPEIECENDEIAAASGQTRPSVEGLGALKSEGWWHALSRNYRYLFNEATCWRTQIKRYFSG